MNSSTIDNGVKLLGEVAVPGGSLYLDGKIASGALHTIAGLALAPLVGPLGVLLVRANSYTTSVTDASLLGAFTPSSSGSSEGSSADEENGE